MHRRIPHVAIALTIALAAGCKSSSSQKQATAEEPGSASSEKTETTAQELYVRGNKHLAAGEWDAAIKDYRAATDKNSERWDAWLNLGIAYSRSKQFQKALDAMEKCLANGGEGRPEVYYNLGNIYQKRGLYRQAIKAYRANLAHSDEPSADTLTNIGATLVILDRPEDALETYKRAQRVAPENARVQHGIAIALYMNRKYEDSISAFDRLHSMEPDYARAYFDEAKPLVELDRHQEAIRSLETYLEKSSDGKYAAKAKAQLERLREMTGASKPAQ